MALFIECEFKPEDVIQLEAIGFAVNNRRERTVNVFRHPTDFAKVVTVGTTFDRAATVIAVEPAAIWQDAFFQKPRIAV